MDGKLFLQVLNMSFTASFIICIVLLGRLALKRSPKIFSYGLWSVVLFRLLCPFSFESFLSLVPIKTNPIPTNIGLMTNPQIETGIVLINNSVNSILPSAAPYSSINPLQVWIFIGSMIWLIGIIFLLTYSISSFFNLKKILKDATPYENNIFISDKISTAFVMGIMPCKIYLPNNLTSEEVNYILIHEQTHIKRKDHIIKLISYIALCIHWFNPLVWISYHLSNHDMELSCDESVIKKLGSEVKKRYSSSLLNLATGKSLLVFGPLAFGEGDTKSRVINILNYKKPTFRIIGVTLLLVIGFAIALISNPQNNTYSLQKENTVSQNADELWASRTLYLGDAPAVSKIINLLEFPYNYNYSHIELDTKGDNRKLAVYFNEGANWTYNDINKLDIQSNALLLFLLIDNLKDVDFISSNPSGEIATLSFDRQWADSNTKTILKTKPQSSSNIQNIIASYQNNTSKQAFEPLITQAILQNNKSSNNVLTKAFESHINLDNSYHIKKDAFGDTVTVYLMVLYEEYDFSSNPPKLISDSYIPTIITLNSQLHGSVEVKEYWTPRDGDYYPKDIESNFPGKLKQTALDAHKFIDEQKKSIKEQLSQVEAIDVKSLISSKLDNILQKQKDNSISQLELQQEISNLTVYEDAMLVYGFNEFLTNNLSFERAELLEIICREILKSTNEDVYFENLKRHQWFDSYLTHIKALEAKEGIDYVEKYMPKAYMLLKML